MVEGIVLWRFTSTVFRCLTYIDSPGMAKRLLSACSLNICSSIFHMKTSSSMRLGRETARLLSISSTTCKIVILRSMTAHDTKSSK